MWEQRADVGRILDLIFWVPLEQVRISALDNKFKFVVNVLDSFCQALSVLHRLDLIETLLLIETVSEWEDMDSIVSRRESLKNLFVRSI